MDDRRAGRRPGVIARGSTAALGPGGGAARLPAAAMPGPRLRIALVAPPYIPVPPPGYGGIERVVALLADGLVARGHDVTLFAAAGSATAARLIVPLPVAPVLGDADAIAEELAHAAAAYLDAGSYHVVHDHTGSGALLGGLVAPGTPVVHTLHGPWTERSRRQCALVHDRVHLVAISDAQRCANPSVRYAATVHNGIDLSAHPFVEEKEDYLVFVGRISPEKRPELAIEIARRAGRRLAMVVKRSEPSERAYWDEVVAPRLGADVEVFEQPPHDVKVDVIGRARAMVFPIDWPEPFGLVMTEAMACGTPVIARPLGAASEVVVDGVTGFLRRSVDEMAAAVGAVDRISARSCRLLVEARFSSGAMVAAYEHVYRALAVRAPGTAGAVPTPGVTATPVPPLAAG